MADLGTVGVGNTKVGSLPASTTVIGIASVVDFPPYPLPGAIRFNLTPASIPGNTNLIGFRQTGALSIVNLGSPIDAIHPQGTGKSITVGNLLPSLRLSSGQFRIRIPIQPGPRVVSVDVYQPSPPGSSFPPKFLILANPDVGVPIQLTATYVENQTWQTLSHNFTSTQYGGVEVVFVNPEKAPTVVYWDNLTVA